MRVGRARQPAARRSVARRYATPRSAARRAATPRSAARRAAAGQTPLADDTSSSFHTPAPPMAADSPAPAAPSAPATERTLLENKVRELEEELLASQKEVIGLKRSIAEMSSASSELELELLDSQKEVIGLKSSIAEMSSASSELRAEFESLQRQSNHEQARLRNNVTLANAEIQDLQVSVLDFFIHLF